MPALPGFSQFKTDTTGEFDGVLPFDTPLSSFQIGHDIIWEFTNISPVGGLSAGTGTGYFEYKLLKPADNSIDVWQRVTLTFSWVAMGLGGFLNGGLDLFVWSFTKEVIDTYVINGAPTDKHPDTPDAQNPAWSYTIGNSPLAEFGIAIPGGGSGTGQRGGIITSFWQGPLYSRNVTLSASAKLDIVRDQWLAQIARLPLWHVRATAGVSEMDAFMHDFGVVCKAYALGVNSQFDIGYANGFQEHRGIIGEGSQPSITQDPAGMIYAHVIDSKGVAVYESVNTGHTFKRSRGYVDKTSTDEEDLYAWGTGFAMPRIIDLNNGTRGTIAIKNAQIYWKTSRDNYKGIIVVGPAKSTEDYEIVLNEDGTLYVEAAGRQAFISTSGGELWEPYYYPGEPVPETEQPAT